MTINVHSNRKICWEEIFAQVKSYKYIFYTTTFFSEKSLNFLKSKPTEIKYELYIFS